jgi:PRTRC genetic system protein C
MTEQTKAQDTQQPQAEEKKPPRRIFKYGDQQWEDPGQEYTDEEVRKHLQTHFPELAKCRIVRNTLDDGTIEVSFEKVAGRKG